MMSPTRECLHHSVVQRPVESALPVHVLPVPLLLHDARPTHVRPFHLLPLRAAELHWQSHLRHLRVLRLHQLHLRLRDVIVVHVYLVDIASPTARL